MTIRKKLRWLILQNAKAATQNFKEHEEPKKSHHQKITIYNNRTKNMDIGGLSDKKFRIAVSRNLNEQQESIEKQFNKIYKQNEKFNN